MGTKCVQNGKNEISLCILCVNFERLWTVDFYDNFFFDLEKVFKMEMMGMLNVNRNMLSKDGGMFSYPTLKSCIRWKRNCTRSSRTDCDRPRGIGNGCWGSNFAPQCSREGAQPTRLSMRRHRATDIPACRPALRHCRQNLAHSSSTSCHSGPGIPAPARTDDPEQLQQQQRMIVQRKK